MQSFSTSCSECLASISPFTWIDMYNLCMFFPSLRCNLKNILRSTTYSNASLYKFAPWNSSMAVRKASFSNKICLIGKNNGTAWISESVWTKAFALDDYLRIGSKRSPNKGQGRRMARMNSPSRILGIQTHQYSSSSMLATFLPPHADLRSLSEVHAVDAEPPSTMLQFRLIHTSKFKTFKHSSNASLSLLLDFFIFIRYIVLLGGRPYLKTHSLKTDRISRCVQMENISP